MADLQQTIQDAATSPASVTQDGGTTVARPIADLIAADQYLAGKTAATKPRRGLRYSRVQKPGAI